MTGKSVNERVSLAIKLLEELKELNKGLEVSAKALEASYGTVLEDLYESKKDEVKEKIEAYNHNTNIVRSLHFEITARVNTWYEFSRNTRSLNSPIFPAKFYFARRKLQRSLKVTGDTISRLIIENRFIREQLTLWERSLFTEALKLTENAGKSTEYRQMAKDREEIIKDLKYLLPTIPGASPVEIFADSIEVYSRKLADQ